MMEYGRDVSSTYIGMFAQLYFTISTNSFSNLQKYKRHFGQINDDGEM